METSRRNTGTLPEGTYPATLTDIRFFENAYGRRVGFIFELQGKAQGRSVMCSARYSTAPNGKLANIIERIMGRALAAGELEDFDYDRLRGRECLVMVLTGRNRSGKRFSYVDQIFQPAALLERG
ncbi:hypothetical protein [Geoalkalibacter subterraneus]|uniref:Uncharacterized protein n=1 Tax=Geoalkalibacter subterraneus TaxID=483547 RepID=A0A0B5FP92_9BACT|nr:hypothetical protein [Geoalkalibacter subterraneus]AJF05426.1 hypothetical protein GSUB_00870 [Geoalkalibacter subterraneus]